MACPRRALLLAACLVSPTLLRAEDEAAAAVTDGACVAGAAPGSCDAAGVAHARARGFGSGLLPPCQEEADLDELLEKAKVWCNPARVPEDKRVPKKLQGLFWLKGLPLADVAACFSIATWNAETLTLDLNVWDSFLFRNDFQGRGMASAVWLGDMHYHIKFNNSDLREADIAPAGSTAALKAVSHSFAHIASFPFYEMSSEEDHPGDKWARPSFFGINDKKVLTNVYEAWKVLDGDLQVRPANSKLMHEWLDRQIHGMSIIRYSRDCELHAAAAAAAIAPASGSEVAVPTPCGAGVFLRVTRQVALGLRHLPVTQAVPFVQLTSGQCAVRYTVACKAGVPEVQEESLCSEGHSLKGPAVGPLHHSWEVCNYQGVELRLLHPVTDLTWDTEMPENLPIEGCVQVTVASDLPHLDAVRGSEEEQKAALISRKKLVGGCPTFTSMEDRMERASDFATSREGGTVFANFAKVLSSQLAARGKLWARSPPGSTLGLLDTAKDVAQLGTWLTFFGVGADQNRSTVFNVQAALNCGEPSPFLDGPALFRYEQVAQQMTHPAMRRTYTTWTVKQDEACFDPTGLLFLSSGSPEHTQVRRLLDEAGWATMHQNLPSVEALTTHAALKKLKEAIGAGRVPSEADVAQMVMPMVIQAVWNKKPTQEDVELAAAYLKVGKACIFGSRAAGTGLLRFTKLQDARKMARRFAADSPYAEKMAKLLEKPEYAAAKALYSTRGDPVQTALGNAADGMLFAGVLGTSDMTTKCIKWQMRDRAHVRMFRKDRVAYLHELMRLDGAVASVTTALEKNETWKLEGSEVALPEGSPVQLVFSAAHRDASVFHDPLRFDPERPDAGEALSWNGKLRHVIARDYAAAPRFCPGYQLSIAIAEKVCDYLTEPLHPWGEKSQDSGFHGLVRITSPGPVYNREGVVSYFDFHKQKHCVVDRYKTDVHLGCFEEGHLKLVSKHGGFAHTLEEELAQCPSITPSLVGMVAHIGVKDYQAGWGRSWLIEKVFGRPATAEVMTPDWAADYVVALYTGISASLQMYQSRHSSWIKVPTRTGRVPSFRVGHIKAPNVDIDHPHFVPIERFVPESLYESGFLPAFNCFHGTLRTMPWDDMLEDDERNTWATVLSHARGTYKRKVDWVMSFYEPYKTLDGLPIWPQQEYDLGGLYWKADAWDDGLEHALAFGLIGSHRVEETSGSFGGEPLKFVVRTNDYNALEVRPHFGKYGCDLYFNENGMPVMAKTPDGREVARGDHDWQYWKFVWRSSLITVITLVDHLHLAHFRAANLMAGAVRMSLSPRHPIRRLLSIFTFGSIFVNLNAMHTLIGPNHALHRSTPFKEFEGLSNMVPESLPAVDELHAPVLSDEAYSKLHPKLQEAPYFQDGRLLMKAITKLLQGFMDTYGASICGPGDRIVDQEVSQLWDHLVEENLEAHYATKLDKSPKVCSSIIGGLQALIWTVTGWHRHVGTVGDYYKDPDLASFAWRDGQPHGIPKQHMIMSTVAAFTGTQQPKIIEDFSHVFAGVEREAEAVAVLRQFREDLKLVHEEVARRNEKRLTTWGFKNIHADPEIVECSVAV